MGALKGRMSPLGFFVKGRVEDWNAVLDNLKRYRFQELDPASGRQQSFGWTRLGEPFDTQFTKQGLFFGESLVGLSLRVDSINIPASQVKLRLAPRIREKLAQTGKEALSKSELASMKEDLVAELSRRFLPIIRVFDMLYDEAAGRLWFFGKAKGIVETFLGLFYETFSPSTFSPSTFSPSTFSSTSSSPLSSPDPAGSAAAADSGPLLVPDSPYTAARELLGEEEADRLMELEPAHFEPIEE